MATGRSVEAKLMKHENIFVVFDIETGGLKKEEHALAEIGAAAFDWNLNNLPEEFCEIIAPYDDKLTYVPQALAVNGLTMDDLNKGKPFEEVMYNFIKYLAAMHRISKKKSVVIGHNIDSFDIPWILYSLDRVNLTKDFWKYVDSYYIDTLCWSRIRHTDIPNFKLGTVVELNNIQITNAHSALGDVYANRDLAKEYIKSLRGLNSGETQSVVKPRFRETFQF